ncbi:MAG: hypothetical protein ABI353_02780 [Isosphaeraceae bacterium]
MRLSSRLFLFPSAMLSLLAMGCAEEFGPEPMPTTPVAGQVRLRGRPVDAGWIEFLPTEGTIGTLRSAPITSDGRFQTDQVPLGVVAIRIVGARPGPTGDPALDRFLHAVRQSYVIRRDTRRDPDALVIDLDVEQVRLTGRRSLGARSEPNDQPEPGVAP